MPTSYTDIPARAAVFAGLEAQRWQAEQAGRPNVTPEQTARELSWKLTDAIKDGRLDEARAVALELKPLLGWLKDERR